MLEEVNSQILTDEKPEQIMEVTLREFDELVEDKKALDRMLANPDFNRIVVNKYFMLEFERLSGLLKSNNSAVVKDREVIVAKIVAIGYMEQFIQSLATNLTGLDNPEQRIELLSQIAAYEAEEAGGVSDE